MPETIGVVGVGTMSSAMVRGLCAAGATAKFVLSPRNAAKSAKLHAELPETVRVAKNNQEVVDSCQCVILAVLPKQADAVLSELTFRKGQQILSVIATVGLERLRNLAAPATDCVVCVPLPAVAKRQGATIALPERPFAKAICSALGDYVPVENEVQFKLLQTITALMGDFYKRQLTAQQWLESKGMPKEQSAAWIGAVFKAMATDSAVAGPDTLQHLVGEQTPGGFNEMVWRDQEADGAYQALLHSLDSAHHRYCTGQVDAELAPVRKRARTQVPMQASPGESKDSCS